MEGKLEKLSLSWYFGAIAMVLMALGLLFMSLWRQIDQQVEKSLIELDDPKSVLILPNTDLKNTTLPQHESLPELRYLPHHPFYLARMIYERIKLEATASPIEKAKLFEIYADERMGTSLQLIKMGRGREAIEASAKGYMYLLQAAETLRMYKTNEARELWNHLAIAAVIHEQVLITLQDAVAEPLKGKVGSILRGVEMIKKEAEREGGDV